MERGWLKIEGDVCVVTGALGGMGRQIIEEFARNGANVALVDIVDEEKINAVAEELAKQYGIKAAGFRCNVSDEKEVDKLVERVVKSFGRADVLVNTAGILRFAPMEDLSLDDWNETMTVNLTGYFLTSRGFGRQMIKQKSGRLVHISTVASHQPESYSGAYSPSKAGVNMLSKMLAVEWGPFGIRSNCVCPCFVKTPLSKDFYKDPKVEEGRARLIANRRIGEVEDIANAIAFLASPRSDFINGSELNVDGGFSIMMGDLTPKPGGRRGYAEKWLKEREERRKASK